MIMGTEASWNSTGALYHKIKSRLKEHDIILDAGCGSGTLGNYINGMFGIDVQKKSIQMSREKGTYMGLRFGDVQKIPYPDNSFDVVICHEVLHYGTINLKKAFEEFKRVCKKDGLIIVSMVNFRARILSHVKKGNLWKLKEVIKNHNLTIEENLDYFEDIEKIYVSRNKKWLRNMFGKYLSTYIIGIYINKEKKK